MIPGALLDWRGAPVMPAAWLDGYRQLYPLHRESPRIGGPEQQRRARRLALALAARRDDGRPWPEQRGRWCPHGPWFRLAPEVPHGMANARD